VRGKSRGKRKRRKFHFHHNPEGWQAEGKGEMLQGRGRGCKKIKRVKVFREQKSQRTSAEVTVIVVYGLFTGGGREGRAKRKKKLERSQEADCEIELEQAAKD